MRSDPVHRELPPRRWARVVGLVAAGLWLVAAWAIVRWVLDAERSLGREQAARGGVLVALVLAALLVAGILATRSLSDAVLTYTDDVVRFHCGERKTIRWARIETIENRRLGRPMLLHLHSSTRTEVVEGTAWLTAAQREELAAELAERVRLAHRWQRRAQASSQARGPQIT